MRLALPTQLTDCHLVCQVIPDPASKLIATLEVMIQESLTCFTLRASQLDDLEKLRNIFGSRACFGIHGIDVGNISDGLAAKPAFVMLNQADPDTVQAALEVSVPVVAPGLTPTEVATVWDLGVSAVAVAPAECLGPSYAKWLPKLVPDAKLMPMCGLASYAVTRWLNAGAQFAALDETFLADSDLNSLGRLRTDVAAMVAAAQLPRPA